MKVAIYLRKSRADIEAENLARFETLGTHRAVLMELAKQRDFTIVKIYEEIVSGESIEGRSQMKQLLEDVYTKRYDAVLVMDIDRLGRGNAKDQGTIIEAFKYSKTLIVTPIKTYDANDPFDEEYLEFGQFMSRKELKLINRRMLAGRLASKKSGNYIAPFPPYGYDIFKPQRGVRTLIENDESKHVRNIFTWSAYEGLNVREIADRLTHSGVLTRKGCKWNATTIRQILLNEVYIGMVVDGRRKYEKRYEDGEFKTVHTRAREYQLYDGHHEPLIDRETFALVSKLFNTNPTVVKTDLHYLFSGLIRCAECNVNISFQQFRKRPGTRSRINHKKVDNCKMKSMYYDDFHKTFVSALKGRIKDFRVELNTDKGDASKAEYDALKARMVKDLKGLETKRSRLFDMLEDGTYTRNEFLERKDIYNAKIESLTSEIENLVPPEIIDYKQVIVTFQDVLDSLDNPEIPNIKKNKLLKSIVERIEYRNTNGNDISIDIHFKI